MEDKCLYWSIRSKKRVFCITQKGMLWVIRDEVRKVITTFSCRAFRQYNLSYMSHIRILSKGKACHELHLKSWFYWVLKIYKMIEALCVSQLSITVTKYLRQPTYKEKMFILVHSVRDSSSWLVGHNALGPW
jgi:hypothetical protein